MPVEPKLASAVKYILLNDSIISHEELDMICRIRCLSKKSRDYLEETIKNLIKVDTYENYEIKGDISKSTWQKVVETLPAYIKDDAEKPHYYEYSVTETEIKGYTTTIKSSDDGFTFTIINRHFALLPDTGGEGIRMFIIAGGLLLAFLLYTGRRRKRKQTM